MGMENKKKKKKNVWYLQYNTRQSLLQYCAPRSRVALIGFVQSSRTHSLGPCGTTTWNKENNFFLVKCEMIDSSKMIINQMAE